MSAYKVVNLMDVENSVGDRAPEIEGRMARKNLESRDLGVSHWRYRANYRPPVSHRHGQQEEAYVVISGSGRARLDDDVIDLRPMDVIRVAPEVVRAFESGPEGLELIAIGGPRPEEGDGQLVDQPWPDDDL